MKKHLSLLFALLISACSGPATSATSSSSSEPAILSSVESSTSLVETSSTSTTSVISSTSTTSSITSTTSISSVSTSSSSASSTSSSSSSSSVLSSSTSSTSVPTSTSSNSSSQGGEQLLSSLEALNKFHEGLKLKNSTFFVDGYIEEKLIGDEILANHYYGNFAANGDDGYFRYLDQGLYKYKVDEQGNIIVDECKSINKDTLITEFFYTTYDLVDYKSKWKATDEPYVYTSTNAALGELVIELGGQGIFNSVAKSYSNTLEIASDGKSATYTTLLKTTGYGDYTTVLVVSDLGTTKDEMVEAFLASATPMEATNEFPDDVKEAIKEMTGEYLAAPLGASYAHSSYVYTLQGEVADIGYEDFLVGDQVANYRQTLLDAGYNLSDVTDEQGDLKELGYVRYYYEKVVDASLITIELIFYPKVNLGAYEQGLFPNGIFHLRIVKSQIEQ